MALSLFLLGLPLVVVHSFRCPYEKDLAFVNETEFPIVPPKDLVTGKDLWITSLNFFLFGDVSEGADAKIHAGFYDENEQLIYKVILDCGEGTWKTMYDKSKGRGNVRKWKEGKLDGNGCGVGEITIAAHIGCPDGRGKEYESRVPCSRQAYFVVNGQLLEYDFLVILQHDTQYTEPLPVYLRKAKTFRAYVKRDGVVFNRQAYGKCFDFPVRFHEDCLAGNKWLLQYSGSSWFGLGDFGLWPMSNTVECGSYNASESASRTFKTVQNKVVPELSAGTGYKTCCCSYLDGFIDDRQCRTNYPGRQCNDKEANEKRCAPFNTTMFKR